MISDKCRRKQSSSDAKAQDRRNGVRVVSSMPDEIDKIMRRGKHALAGVTNEK